MEIRNRIAIAMSNGPSDLYSKRAELMLRNRRQSEPALSSNDWMQTRDNARSIPWIVFPSLSRGTSLSSRHAKDSASR